MRARDYRARLRANCVRRSMSRKGDCWDNAVPRASRHLRAELVDHEHYAARYEAKLSIGDYIDNFYNVERRQLHLDYLTPLSSNCDPKISSAWHSHAVHGLGGTSCCWCSPAAAAGSHGGRCADGRAGQCGMRSSAGRRKGCVHPAVEQKCADGWCQLPAGCFVMGAPPCEWGRAKRSQNEMLATLTHGFEIQQYELTQKQWTDLGLPNPSGSREDGQDCLEPSCPVGHVTLSEALAFANLLSERHVPPLPACYELSDCTGELGRDLSCTGRALVGSSVYECSGYRLPTKAEWEYAARAGARTAFYNGDITLRPASACAPLTKSWKRSPGTASTGQDHAPARRQSSEWLGALDMLATPASGTTGVPSDTDRPAAAMDYEGAFVDSIFFQRREAL